MIIIIIKIEKNTINNFNNNSNNYTNNFKNFILSY